MAVVYLTFLKLLLLPNIDAQNLGNFIAERETFGSQVITIQITFGFQLNFYWIQH